MLVLHTPSLSLVLNSALNNTKRTLQINCSKRRGKQRYPSEIKKLKTNHKTNVISKVPNKFQGVWRFSKLSVSVDSDPGKDYSTEINDAVLEEIARLLEFPVASMLPAEAFTVVRKSFDARKILKEPKFVYTVDMDVTKLLSLEPRTYDFVSQLEPKVGVLEHMSRGKFCNDIVNAINDTKKLRENEMGSGHNSNSSEKAPEGLYQYSSEKAPKVAVVGSGPSGLFSSLVLAELGADVTLLERGQPVEQRGRDIGALVVRKLMQEESNFCFGEGGAGTWSDGKLVTRIGRNSSSVLAVMKTLVRFGAPESILVDGKPHLGTDRLVPLLRNFRQHLLELGVTIKFGARVDDLVVENSQVSGVWFSDQGGKRQKLGCDAVVLAVGHSARDVYQMLLSHNAQLDPKEFSVGLRIEHPQELINSIQLSALAAEVRKGRGKVPVADYKVAKSVVGEDWDSSSDLGATRSCYSFCMCPGGQVVLTSTNPAELCINGMSFSRRSSKWANAALVVTVSTKDFDVMGFHGPLAGVEFQREFERRAALIGGGNFVVPVQTVPDFFDGKLSASLPPSSYRLGVKAAKLHELFPSNITNTLRQSISRFDTELPGFISKEALLHGVETRTSSPVKICRTNDTYESVSLKGLYPVGEGAGYAGGIVSAAVDGMYGGLHLAKNLGINVSAVQSVFGNAQGAAIVRY